jgi:hypothetical protein
MNKTPMFDWREFPLEVLHAIFLYLNSIGDPAAKKSLTECALSCCIWRLAAQKFFFSEICLDKANNFDKLSCIVLRNDKLGKWVKTLYCTDNCNYNGNASVFLAMDLLFPNLEKIDFKSNNNFL